MDYSKLKVAQLKEELKKRGAPLRGKKAELMERLIAYVNNNNFDVNVSLDPVLPEFDLPQDEKFKDINANSTLPKITRLHIDLYTNRFEKKDDMGEAMYKNQFLEFVRYCKRDDTFFFKGVVHAQMYKKVTYNVHLKIANDATIEATHCECAAGEGGSAHCKHVIVVLLGIEQMVREGDIILSQACTQKLQTFHQPKKKYQGTPLKAACLKSVYRCNHIQFGPRPPKYKGKNIKERLHNLCASFHSNMPFKHLLVPANPYGVELDHTYSKMNPKNKFLQYMLLRNVTQEDIVKIEIETRGQSNNPLWFAHRKIRITASHFKDCCMVKNEEAAKSLALRLLNPKKIHSEALDHGIINEPVAIRKYIEYTKTKMEIEESGLIVSKERPYLAVSPDRLLGPNCLIEVKCSYTSRNREINPITVPYLYFKEENVLCLKRDHQYMYQIQGQLFVVNKEICYLVPT
ncbi:hypothetical protein ALC57_01994 [Trachymyrmex cornetzi]|uniref:SWIM-type domain-containing protein n=1 Tax=Trachymyrmex cornetzi TaxID=471704 RepID=A0A151JP94_9HYME|nr:hypothetical protein ALC57_01994 [Trachymyrmex cornetzi]